jgi:hypothetical protein
MAMIKWKKVVLSSCCSLLYWKYPSLIDAHCNKRLLEHLLEHDDSAA